MDMENGPSDLVSRLIIFNDPRDRFYFTKKKLLTSFHVSHYRHSQIIFVFILLLSPVPTSYELMLLLVEVLSYYLLSAIVQTIL